MALPNLRRRDVRAATQHPLHRTDRTRVGTTLTSGAAGAIAGGVVSWVAAPHVAWRQERGQTRADARQKLGELVTPVLTEMRQYQDHARGDLRRGDEEKEALHSSDITLCSRLLSASSALPRWRRSLVKRRLVQLFGQVTVDLCTVHHDFGNDGKAALRIVLNRQLNWMDKPERFKQPTGSR